jgi:hypothetical protein
VTFALLNHVLSASAANASACAESSRNFTYFSFFDFPEQTEAYPSKWI